MIFLLGRKKLASQGATSVMMHRLFESIFLLCQKKLTSQGATLVMTHRLFELSRHPLQGQPDIDKTRRPVGSGPRAAAIDRI
jgi:hypothetical protein